MSLVFLQSRANARQAHNSADTDLNPPQAGATILLRDEPIEATAGW